MELNQSIVRQLMHDAWMSGKQLSVYSDHDAGIVVAAGEGRCMIEWGHGAPRMREHRMTDYRRLEAGTGGYDLQFKYWNAIPRELKIQDVFAGVRGWVPRRDGPVWRVPMPLPVPYEISTEPQNVMLEMDVLEFRLEDDGRVTCEGVEVQRSR